MIVVWGANGFIGRHVADALQRRGDAALLLARDFDGFPFPLTAAIQQIADDFTDTESWIERLRPCTTLILLVSASGVGTFAQQPEAEWTYNIAPYQNLFAAMRRHDIKPRQIIYLSSGGAVYGVTEHRPIAETHATAPISPYGQAKLKIEALLTSYAAETGMTGTILRVANPVGRWSKKPNLLSMALQAAKGGPPLQVRGDGSMARDYFAVEELAECVANVMDKVSPGTFNVGSSQSHAVSDIVALVEDLTGKHVSVHFTASSPFDVPYNVLDCRKILAETGWKARKPLEDIISELKDSA